MIYEIQDLSFAYSRNPVVDRLSLSLKRGEFTAVVGPNGAGKSTLLKLMAGLLSGFDGSIALMGKAIDDYKPVELARKLAFVPQETHVVFPFTVEEMILMGRTPYRKNRIFDDQSDAGFVDQAMTLTATTDLRRKTFNQISGGERQRVVLASALAQTPEVLLLDEPTVYLDLKHQFQFYQILERLNAKESVTVVAVTHDINLAARFADRMIAVQDGRIAADGHPDQVLTPDTLHDVFGITAEIIEGSDGAKCVIASA